LEKGAAQAEVAQEVAVLTTKVGSVTAALAAAQDEMMLYVADKEAAQVRFGLQQHNQNAQAEVLMASRSARVLVTGAGQVRR
jgi:hypothetical protein